MLSFCQWLQSTAFFTELRGSGIFYPTILALHVLAIAMFGCMILVTDVRLLGGMGKYPVSFLLDRLRVPKRIGFALIVTCGLLLFGAKAEEYYYNVFFRTKVIILLLILIHAALFRTGVYRNGAVLDARGLTGQARLAGGLSLVLWIGMVVCGRGIGYIEPPLFILHARAGHMESPRDARLVKTPRDARLVKTPRDARLVKTPRDAQLVKTPEGAQVQSEALRNMAPAAT